MQPLFDFFFFQSLPVSAGDHRMALPVPRYVDAGRPAAAAAVVVASVIGRKRGSFTRVIVVRASANFKQNKQQHEQQMRQGRSQDVRSACPSSPLRTVDEVASRLGREIALANLERLFRQQAAGVDRPPANGGSSDRPVRVAYQGSRGSYCQEATARAFPSSSACEVFPCAHMEEAFAVLEDRSADRAVVPAENSLDGPIDRNLDLLLRHPGIRILAELVLPVNHCLLSLPGAPRSSLRRVISHPQALSHCRRNLEALDLEVDEVWCTADAARFVAENRVADTAVIWSQMAAREFGLRILVSNFQDHHQGGNFNRFLQLGLSAGQTQEFTGGGVARKTTVAFSLEGGASDLFRAMWIFESRGVRVTRVDHRPNRAKPLRVVDRGTDGLGKATYLDYVFVLDVDGSALDAAVAAALAQLEEIAVFARVLGSYASTCHSR
ncbi:Arogenate dehydratase prephenate dehydratase [Musa troglodytarum]|uniref:Arogenate dehydratase prephenate dehydratase n=1 Tax=Musa troglodytarum TaxID=320322 RepID=A0A9E7EI49_9LILI|nr:Arogenate dehydratase prephenate dehydratase [Musa troglodytarum]